MMENSTTKTTPNYISPSSDTNLGNFIYTIITINAVSAFVSLVFNFLIICAFVKTSTLRTPSFILILSLAISDLGVGGVVQTALCTWLFSLYSVTYDVSKGFTSFKIYHYSSNSLLSSSLLTMTFITVDRFLALRLRLRYQLLVTAKKYYIALAAIWVFSLSWTIWVYNVAFFIIIVIAIVTSLTHITLMILISRDIKRHSRQVHVLNQTSQPTINMVRFKRSVKTLYCIMAAFAVCYCPYWFYHIVRFATKAQGVELFYANISLLTVIYINSTINPFIYCWRIREIRNAVLKILWVY